MIHIDRYRCTYCGGCVSVCPVEALTLAETRLLVGSDCMGGPTGRPLSVTGRVLRLGL